MWTPVTKAHRQQCENNQADCAENRADDLLRA